MTIPFGTFFEHPKLLGSQFSAPTWANWRITLKAAFGEPLDRVGRAQFRKLAERDPPPGRVSELWMAVGRRAGKDSVASAVCAYLAIYGDFSKHVRLGERITILCLAVDRVQSGIVFGYIRALFENIPLLKALLVSANDGVVALNNGCDIVVATNSFRTIRGRTVACAVCDEIAFWRDETSANPDREVYTALMPAMITLRRAGAMLIGMSSVYRRQGLLYEKFTKHHAKPDANVLFIRAPSIVYNPTLAQPAEAAEIERLRAEDRERAAAEWDSEWRSDISSFFDRAALEAAIDRGVGEREYDPRCRYIAATDESGGNGRDASTFTICHLDANRVVVQDLVRVWRPPFKPGAVIREKARLCRAWCIHTIHSDNWGGGLPPDLYLQQGVKTVTLPRKSELYLDLLHITNSGRLRMLDHPQTLAEAVALERRTRFGGGEVIDHSMHGNAHDDAINVLAAAVHVAAGKPVIFKITTEAMMWSRVPDRYGRGGMMPRLRRLPANDVPPSWVSATQRSARQ